MFNKKRIIILVAIALVTVLSLGAVFIVGGLPETPQRPKQLYKKVYVKEGMSDITFKFNGEDIVFKYDHTEKNPMDREMNIDGKDVLIITDHYKSEDGASAIKYEDKDTFHYVFTSGPSKPQRKLSDEQVEKIAYAAINSSDFGIKATLDPEKAAAYEKLETLGEEEPYLIPNENGTYTQVMKDFDKTIEVGEKSVSVYLDYSGSVRSISVRENANAKVTEEQKRKAQEKFDNFIKKKFKNSNAKIEVEEANYQEISGKIYAFFSTTYYPAPGNDNPASATGAHSVYSFFCEV